MINLCIDKKSILDVDESDIEDMKDQLLIIYKLLYACKHINYYLDCANRDSTHKVPYIVKNTFKYIIKTIENDEYLRIFDIDADCREVISILQYYNILNLKGSNTDEYKVYFTDCGVLSCILRDNNYSKADTDRIIQKAFKQN